MDARIEVAEREHLHVLQQRRHGLGARQQGGHHHHRAGIVRDALNAIGEVETRQAARRDRPGDHALDKCDRDVGGRDQQKQQRDGHGACGSALTPEIRRARGQQERRHDRDRDQIDERRMREHQTPYPFRERRPIGKVGFEVATPLIDEVVPDVGGPIGGRSAGGRLAGAFDCPQSDPHLRVSARRRELLNRLALSISTEEVHPSVRTGGIALQCVLDQTHGLDILAPIEGGAQAQAGNGIGHRDLVGRLPLMLAANRRFGGRLLRREVLLDRRPDRRQPETILAEPMQELDEVGDVEGWRQRCGVSGFASDPGHVRVGGQARAARRQRLGGQTSQVFDERKLQHAGPRPELADRQRSDALVAVDEHGELLAVDPAVAVPHQLDGHGVDPRVTRLLAGCQRGQLPVVGAGQMLVDVSDL